MSIWADIYDRSTGDTNRKGDKGYKIRDVLDLSDEVKNNSEVDLPEVLNRVVDPAFINDSFTIEEKRNRLSSDEMLLLKASALLPFNLGRFSSLNDILEQLNVRVIIEPGIKYHIVPAELYDAKAYWDSKIQRLEKEHGVEYDDAVRMKKDIEEEIIKWENMRVRGEYISSRDKTEQPTIKLYPDEMREECGCDVGEGKKEFNWLLVSTLAHETMHAYFDRPPHAGFSYVASVEEPMAEFGMLLYLYETKQKDAFNWSRNDVRTNPSCYRYGYAFMVQHLVEARKNPYSGKTRTRNDLESYKSILF